MAMILNSGTMSRWRSQRTVLVCALLRLHGEQMQFPAAASTDLQYNRDVRPILVENCFPCHGPDSAARKASLRLDHFDDAIAPRKDDAPAIVPGKPDKSELVHRINATDPDDIMPPAKTGKKLLRRSKKNCSRHWIAGGAKYQPLWSFIAPVSAELPKVRNSRWVAQSDR